MVRGKKGISYNELKKGLRNIDCSIHQYPFGRVDADVIFLNYFDSYKD